METVDFRPRENKNIFRETLNPQRTCPRGLKRMIIFSNEGGIWEPYPEYFCTLHPKKYTKNC